jgi:outer membrane protein TolC
MAGRFFAPRCWSCLALGLTTTLVLWLALQRGAASEQAPEKENKPAENQQANGEKEEPRPPFPGPELAEYRQIALEKQPLLAAYRASLANAQARSQAVDALCVPNLLAPDLPIRREQAALGVEVAAATLHRAEAEIIYDVTRNYLSAVYAASQADLADRILADLEKLKTKKVPLYEAVREAPKEDKEKLDIYAAMVRGRREEALAGVHRALAALREAMGVGCDFPLPITIRLLPESRSAVSCHEAVDLAITRRPELVQTIVTAEIADLEVKTQSVLHGATGRTFAGSSDIHAHPVPPGFHDNEYRPESVGVEMPVTLPGPACYRVEQAQDLSSRAHAVVEKTRGLIRLEVEDLTARLAGTAAKLDHFNQALETARKRYIDIRDDFTSRAQIEAKKFLTLDFVLDANRLGREVRLEYNETLYRYNLLLADLERATAGGICPFSCAAPLHP